MPVSVKKTHNIILSLASASDKVLIKDLLGDRFYCDDYESGIDSSTHELIIVDLAALERLGPNIEKAKKQAGDILLPLIVIVGKNQQRRPKNLWEIADEIIEVPVTKEIFKIRVKNLLKLRRYSTRISVNQKKLKQKNSQLRLYYNAINSTISGMIITDPNRDDDPIIFCNKAFSELTGYSQSEIIGRNCRFLQGDDRDQEGRKIIRESVKNGEPCQVLLRNYKKDGTLFWNELKISPIKNHHGEIEYLVGIQNDVTSLIETQEELRQTKNQWESILEQSPNMVQISVDGIITFINQAGVEMYGAECAEDIVGSTVYEHHKEAKEKVMNRLKRIQNRESVESTIYNITTLDGKERYLKVQSIASEYNGEKAIQTVAEDVTEILNTQKELQRSITQKEVLLQEVHHRVKNNLAVVNALIELQMDEISSKETINYLKDTQMRIVSIAKVHETLYQQTDMSENDFGLYLKSLTDKINSPLKGTEKEINFDIELQDLRLNLDQAVPCSLLLNELISNSQKHGFIEGKAPEIKIKITETDGIVRVFYKDNGRGYEDGFSIDMDGNFGSTVIQIMLTQLGAEWELGNKDGAYFNFEFGKGYYHGPSGAMD